jgi:hypothetical protein
LPIFYFAILISLKKSERKRMQYERVSATIDGGEIKKMEEKKMRKKEKTKLICNCIHNGLKSCCPSFLLFLLRSLIISACLVVFYFTGLLFDRLSCKIRPLDNDGNPCKEETNIFILTFAGTMETIFIGFILACLLHLLATAFVHTKLWCVQMWQKTNCENITERQNLGQDNSSQNLENQEPGQEMQQIS